jgi:ABC-2 type transport system permease protein
MTSEAARGDPMVESIAAGGMVQALGALTVFISLVGMACTIGVVIMTQDAIILEKQTGTAAWVLSKPASRTAFILSKLAASFVGILITIIIVQGAVAYLQIYLATGAALPVLPFLGALGVTFLCLLFYLSLTLMLGTIFNARGGVIAIPLVVAFSYQILLGFAPWLAEIMPWNLTIMLSAEKPPLAVIVAQGLPLPTLGPIIATFIACLIFTAAAIWKFNREEF